MAFTTLTNGIKILSNTPKEQGGVILNDNFTLIDAKLTEVDANTTARHTQGTDTALATGEATEVTAAAIRSHLDSSSNPHSTSLANLTAYDADGNDISDVGTITATTLTDGTASLSSGSITNVKLGSLISNGFVKTSGGDGTLSIDTANYLAEISEDVSPTLGGNLNCGLFRLENIAEIRLGDNLPLSLGTGQDASLLYDGSNLVFNSQEVGSGDFIFENGNVGIGTNSPDTQLHLDKGGSGTFSYIKLESDNFSDFEDGHAIDFFIGTGQIARIRTEASLPTTAGLGFDINGGSLERILYLGSNGNVGIGSGFNGSTEPDAKLEVDGSAIFNTNGDAVDFRIEGDTEPNLFFVDGSADNVGIGTNSPSEKLDISGNLHLTSDSDKLLLGTGKDASISYDGSDMKFNSQEVGSGDFVFENGNVDIGGATTNSILNVKSSATAAATGQPVLDLQANYTSVTIGSGPRIDFGNGSTTFGRIRNLTEASGETGLSFHIYNGSLSEAMRIDANGNVGIGETSPSARVEIKDDGTFTSEEKLLALTYSGGTGDRSLEFTSPTTDSAGAAFNIDTSNAINFRLDAEDVLTLEANKRVGINRTSPNAKLDIFGDANDDALRIYNSVGTVAERTYTANEDGLLLSMYQSGTSGVNFRRTADIVADAALAAETQMRFFTKANGSNAAEAMRIDEDGNVGIGTDSPSEKLDVSGNLHLTSDSDKLLLGTGKDASISYDGSDMKFNSQEVGSGDFVFENGKHVIQKNAITGMWIDDTAAAIGAFTASAHMNLRFDSSRNLNIQTQSRANLEARGDSGLTTIARFTNDGKMGIGETSPDYTLDVNGDIGFAPGSSVTPVDNGDVVFELTDNTTLTVKAKGSDGTVRSGTVNLS